jgi:hypothetical protein
MLGVFLQLFVFARDQRPVNEKTGTATVTVNIDFDEAPRYLDNLPYVGFLQDSASINDPVVQLRGNDPDLKVDSANNTNRNQKQILKIVCIDVCLGLRLIIAM